MLNVAPLEVAVVEGEFYGASVGAVLSWVTWITFVSLVTFLTLAGVGGVDEGGDGGLEAWVKFGEGDGVVCESTLTD